MKVKFTVYLPIMLLLLCLLASCERATKLTIKETNPPTFGMSGSGELGSFRIRDSVPQRKILGEDAFIYWKIRPISSDEIKRVEEIGAITYGKVPTGYVQIYPEEGEAPPLIEGQRYYVYAGTSNADGKGKYFIIRDGKSVEVPER
jgi:hypothetical protein